MTDIKQTLKKTPIIYIARDLERALGLPLSTKGYYIISNYSKFAKTIAGNRKNVLLIKNKEIFDTRELMVLPKVKKFINNIKNAHLLVFKNTSQIEKICVENRWPLLNPPSILSSQVEEKISQLEWLGPLQKYLPKYSVKKCSEIKYDEKPFILQFNRSHTGSGTILVESQLQLNEIKQKFPDREARIAEYIIGPLFTNNNIVTKNDILIGNINYQITGLKPFTDLPFSTIGNDWGLPHKILSKKQITNYKKIAREIGLRLKKFGWRGLFGIDVVMNEKTGQLYLLEINCRQPASTTYESQLQEKTRAQKKDQKINLTTFEAHLGALTKIDLKNKKLISIKKGAQIIQRVTTQIPGLKEPKSNSKTNFDLIKYHNNEPNNDLLRLRTTDSIMTSHNQLNEVGQKIKDFIINLSPTKTR